MNIVQSNAPRKEQLSTQDKWEEAMWRCIEMRNSGSYHFVSSHSQEVSKQQPVITQLLLISWHGLAWKMHLSCLIITGSSTAAAWISL